MISANNTPIAQRTGTARLLSASGKADCRFEHSSRCGLAREMVVVLTAVDALSVGGSGCGGDFWVLDSETEVEVHDFLPGWTLGHGR